MDYVIVGAGAMGSIAGAHLAHAGHKVTMVARGARLQQLRRDGLKIDGLSEIAAGVESSDDPARLKSTDVLIIATKTPGTEELLGTLRHLDVRAVFSLQNGVQKNELLESCFGRERTLGALADTSGEMRADGSVLFTRNVNLLIGELAGGMTERCERIAREIDNAGVRCKAVPNVVSLEWSKFVGWVGLVVLSVTTRSESWRFLEDADSAAVLVRLAREVGALATALGIPLADQAIVPARTMIADSEQQAIECVRELGRTYREKAPQHRLSSLQDLEAGRPLEIHETLGYAVRKARSLNVPVPLLDAFYLALSALDRINRQAKSSA
jgi:2-dehydropantoate 2-reductase